MLGEIKPLTPQFIAVRREKPLTPQFITMKEKSHDDAY